MPSVVELRLGFRLARWKMLDVDRVHFGVLTRGAFVCTCALIDNLVGQAVHHAVVVVDRNRNVLKSAIKELVSTLSREARGLCLKVGMPNVKFKDRQAVLEYCAREAGVSTSLKAACKKDPSAKSEISAKLADVIGREQRQIRLKVKVLLVHSL